MTVLLLAMPGNEPMADALAAQLGWSRLPVTVRHFPDGESFVRIEEEVEGRDVALVCTLDRPDAKLVPLLLLAGAARENGARRVGLVAPYLPYMRQDRRFQAGETTSARHVAGWIAGAVDWLVTVDPHLHRIRSLTEICSIPCRVAHAGEAIATWIQRHVHRPLLVGPDEESTQWVADVAARTGAPHVVLTKLRHADRDVEVSIPEVERWRDRTPVLVDDIISTARTMIETVRHLRAGGLANPVCIAVHGIFADHAFEELRAAGAAQIASTDTVAHASNCIPLAGLLSGVVRELM